LWLHSLKVAQLLRSVACLHTNQSRSYLNHLVCPNFRWIDVFYNDSSSVLCMRVKCRAKRKSALSEDGIGIQSSLIRPEASRVRSPRHASSCIALTRPALAGGSASYQPAYSRTRQYERSEIWLKEEYRRGEVGDLGQTSITIPSSR